MARDHARMKCSMWREADWRNLTIAQQNTYQLLVQHERLSYCGTMPYAPTELAKLSADATDAKIRAAVRSLETDRFVITDDSTHEILVRSYVRHDGLFDRQNMGKAVARAMDLVMSDLLRAAIVRELARYMVAEPGKAGWIGFKSVSPDTHAAVTTMASAMESGIAS